MAGIFTLPPSQALRFINKNELTDLQNYGNRFAYRLLYPNTLDYNYAQKFLNSDPLWVHFRTNYTSITAYLVEEKQSVSIRTDISANLTAVYTDSSDRVYYNLPIDLSALDGCYFIEFQGSDIDKDTFTIQSEVFYIVDSMPRSILIEWFGNYSYNDMMHWVSDKQFVRVDGSDRNFIAGQNKTIYENSNYAPITLKSKSLRQLEIIVDSVPYWVIEKINIALSHDEFYCNSVQYNGEDVIEAERMGDSQMYKGTVTVTQIDFENGEDRQITNGEILQSYLMINDTDYLLINDAGDRLKIN